MAEDESWLDSEIQKELDAINSAELEAPEDTEEPFIEDYEDVSSEDEPLPQSILDYLTKVKVQSEKVQHELDECDTVLEETSVVCHKKHLEFDEDLQHIAQEEGIDVQTLTERVIIELDKEDVDYATLAAINDRSSVGNSSEKLHNPEVSEALCSPSAEKAGEQVLPNTKTQKYSEPKKSETFDLSESDTSCSKEQGSKPNDDQNTGTNYCKNTDKACIVNTGLPIVEDTEHVQVESMCSGDAKVNEWNNNLKTEVIEKDNGSVVVSCNKNNHSNDGCNQDDAESNHGDAESNHGDKTPVEHKSEVDVNAENAENETKEAVPLLPEEGVLVRVPDTDNEGVLVKVPYNEGVLVRVPDNEGVLVKVPDNEGVLVKVPDNEGVLVKVSDNEGVLVRVSDSEVLERRLLLEVTEWDTRRRTSDRLRQQEETARRQEEESRLNEIEEMREKRRQQNVEEEQRLIQQRERTKAEVRKEAENLEKEKEAIQESFRQQQCEIDQLIEETRVERDQLEQSVRERSRSQEQKKQSAATKIQATFRRFQARLRFGAAVEEKREAVRETREAERVRVVEQRIEARNREEEERKQTEEEARKQRERRKQEAAKVKEEVEKKKKEEKAKRKQEEEEKKLVEKQRKQEEKQKKLEEAQRKKEEEKQRKEAAAQRKKEEQARKLEEKKREEEETRRQREDLKTTGGEGPGQAEDTEEQGSQQHEMDHERQPQKVERVKNEGDETKTELDQLRNDEEKQDKGGKKQEEADKQVAELLRTDDMQKKKLEKVTENEAGVKQETGDENEGGKKEGDENRVQKEEGKDRIVGEIHTDKQLSAPKKQDIGEPQKGANDSEQLPDTEQLPQSVQDVTQSQSEDSVTDTGHLAHTAMDSGPKNVQITDSVKSSSKSATKLSCYSSVPKDWGDYLPQTIDTTRLAWIKDCLSWSKIAGSVKMRPGRGSSKRPPRPPASAKTLEPLPEVRLLSITGCTSLQKITTVQLQDLPGCSLTTFGQCVHLKELSLIRCGVVAVEGLEPCTALTYLDLQNNQIEMLAPLKASSGLVYVNLGHNCLSTIHGLDECANIRYLDLSHNRITRIGGGLADLRRLHTLRLQHNQLISSHGIGELITLQKLDLSHNLLPRLDNLQHLALIQVFSASSNNLLQMPELTNQVLLQQLLLNDNSISSMKTISQGWCPLLQQLDLSKNRVALLADLSSCLLLDTIDLKDNQIADLPSLVTALSTTRTVERLDLIGCPVCEETDYRLAVTQVLPTLCSLDGAPASVTQKLAERTEFEEMCLSQAQQETSLRNSHEAALVNCSNLADKSRVHKRYFDRSFQLAVKHRQSHEYGEVTIDPTTTFDLSPATVQVKKVVSQTADMKALFDEAVKNSAKTSTATNIPRPPSGERPKVTRPQNHLLVEKTIMSTVSATESCKETLSEDKAAVRIQALWRGHNLRQNINYYTRMSAARSIQAHWRGYSLRKRLHMAMNYARFGDEDDDSIYGEVNMDDFDFSEADLDKGWTPPETPQLLQNHVVLRPTPGSQPNPAVSVPPLFMHSPFPPEQPRQAWRNPDSPFSQTGYRGGRVPLTPLSVPSETGVTERTAVSKKEEQLTEEWGFKDSRTAELMLQRAKKLKYNVAKKKKLSKLDPQQRLALLRRLEQPQVVHPPTRRVAPRMEYFKGRVIVEEKKVKQEFVEKRERMFEWLHTQVGSFDITSSRINKHLNSGSRDRPESGHNLPLLDPGVIAGGRIQLMGSPTSLENKSVFEGATGETPQPPAPQRRLSMQEEYPRGRLPEIKTTSAPVVRVKEKMSWRSKHNARTSGGWGGGRKRSKPA